MRAGVFQRIIFAVCFCFLFCVGGYTLYLKNRTVVPLGKEFYFLTVQAEGVEVSALEVQKDGGAGFLLPSKYGRKIALSVYFNQTDGEKVFVKNQEKYQNLSLVCVRCDSLYFGGESVEERKAVLAALNTLSEHISLLNELIERVENGQTQEASKRILGEISENFDYLTKLYRKKFPVLSKIYQRSGTKIQKQTADLVFAKDLRYVVCELSKGYIDFTEKYSV